MQCPQCKNDAVAEVEINVQNLFICHHCHTTFIPQNQMIQLNRVLFSPTKTKWKEALQKSPNQSPSTLSTCLFHPESQTSISKVPDYSHQCAQTHCCESLQLTPVEMLPILELGERTQEEFKSSYKNKRGWNPFHFLFQMFKGNKQPQDLDLEEIQFARKFAPHLKDIL